MKKIILLIIAIISLSSIAFTQQKYSIVQINNTTQDSISYILDISFADYNTGYLTAVKNRFDISYNPIGDKNYVFKTTDGGNTWAKKWEQVSYGLDRLLQAWKQFKGAE